MVFMTVRSLGSFFRTFSYSVMAFGNLPCCTNFSAALRTFCLLKPKPKAIRLRTPTLLTAREPFRLGEFADYLITDRHFGTYQQMVFRTRAIVRLGRQNRMVTNGYQKGVYNRVTLGTGVAFAGL